LAKLSVALKEFFVNVLNLCRFADKFNVVLDMGLDVSFSANADLISRNEFGNRF